MDLKRRLLPQFDEFDLRFDGFDSQVRRPFDGSRRHRDAEFVIPGSEQPAAKYPRTKP